MSKCDCAVGLLWTSLIFSLLSMAGLLLGGFGNVWWIEIGNDFQHTQGLWQSCVKYTNGTHVCTDVQQILQFRVEKGTDPIMICFTLSAFFLLVFILTTIGMICCIQKQSKGLRKARQYSFVLILIAVVCSVDALVYFEYEFRDQLSGSTRGWSYMAGWAGAGLQVVLLAFTLIQCGLKPAALADQQETWQRMM